MDELLNNPSELGEPAAPAEVVSGVRADGEIGEQHPSRPGVPLPASQSHAQRSERHVRVSAAAAAPSPDRFGRLAALLAVGLERWVAQTGPGGNGPVDFPPRISVHGDAVGEEERGRC